MAAQRKAVQRIASQGMAMHRNAPETAGSALATGRYRATFGELSALHHIAQQGTARQCSVAHRAASHRTAKQSSSRQITAMQGTAV